MVRALVIHDDAATRALIGEALGLASFEIDTANDGPEGLTRLADAPCDVVVVGVMLPSQSGIAVLHELHRHHDGVAVVMVSDTTDPGFAVIALEADADDYCTLPMSDRELVLRVQRAIQRRTLLRSSGAGAAAVVDREGLSMDPVTRVAALDGVALELTVKEFDLLRAFASSPDRVFSRSELLELVWRTDPEGHSVDTVTEHVYRLRGKLDAAGSSRRWIETVRGAGYRFVAAAPTAAPASQGAAGVDAVAE